MALNRDNVTYQSKYGDIAGVNDAFNRRIEAQAGIHSDSDANRKLIASNIDQAGDQFKNLFKNSVGREATDQEVAQFFNDSGNKAIQNSAMDNPQALRNMVAQYVGDTAQGAAQDTATQKAKDLSSQYGSLADQYMEMGKKSLGNLSNELQAYSTSLFDKLRPQLNLAAQAGGYADSGGQTLQEQGALTDLANQGRGVLANAAYDVENNANNIRYGGMAAPVSMSSQYAANAPYAVQSLGSGGLNFNNADYNANQDYLRKLGLINAQSQVNQASQPGFGTRLWQQLATGAAQGFTGGIGNQLNQYAYGQAGGPDHSRFRQGRRIHDQLSSGSH